MFVRLWHYFALKAVLDCPFDHRAFIILDAAQACREAVNGRTNSNR